MSEPLAELVHYDVDGAIATITLDSPHNRNALSRQLVTELLGRLEEADGDDTVLVVRLESADRVFCSGADLSEASTVGMEEGARRMVAVQRALIALGTPVVTRLTGPVRAGGIGIVASSDIVVASEEANFALTEVKLGLAAAIIAIPVFHRMGPRAASFVTLTGEVFGGAEAAAYGLVTTVRPADDVDAEMDRVCAALATGAPQGLRESKRMLNRDLLAKLDAEGDELAAFSATLFASDAAREAMSAFLSRTR